MTRFEHVGNCKIVKLVLEGELTEILFILTITMKCNLTIML